MKLKANIETIRTVFNSDNSLHKHEVLDDLESFLPECDIFPFGILLPALSDADSLVRERILSLLRYCDYQFSDDEYLSVLKMIEKPDEGVRQIALEVIVAVFRGLKFEIFKIALPYLWHCDARVRETAAQLFTEFSYQITEDMYVQLAEAYSLANISVRESIAGFLERNGQGCLINQ